MTLGQSELLRKAQIAMGSSQQLYEDWFFQNRIGWDAYWNPNRVVSFYARQNEVRNLIWC